MRKLTFLVTAFFLVANSFASLNIVAPPKLNAKEIFIPVGKTGYKISLMDLSRISQKDLEVLTGKKMGFFDRISFKIAQRKLRKGINQDGTISKKKLERFFMKRDGETGIHWGGFALGFFLLLIGVLIAYVMNDDYKSNRVKWAWIGCSVALGLELILVTILASSTGY